MKEKGLYFEYKNNSIFLYESIKRKDKWKNKRCLLIANKNSVDFKIPNIYGICDAFYLNNYEIINNINDISQMFFSIYDIDFKQNIYQYPVIHNEKLMILEIFKFLREFLNLQNELPIQIVNKLKSYNNIYEYIEKNDFKLNKIFNNGLYSDLFMNFNATNITDSLDCPNYLISLINIRMNELGLDNFQKYTFNAISFFRYIYMDNLDYYLNIDNESLRKIFDIYIDIYDLLQINLNLYSEVSETIYCLVYSYGKENVLYYLELVKFFLNSKTFDKFHNHIITIYWLKRLFSLVPPKLDVLPKTLYKWNYLDNYLQKGTIEKYKILEKYNNILLYDDVKINSKKYTYQSINYKFDIEETFSDVIKVCYNLKYDFLNILNALYNKEALLIIKDTKNNPIAIITIKNQNIIGFYEDNIIKDSHKKEIDKILKEYVYQFNLNIILK